MEYLIEKSAKRIVKWCTHNQSGLSQEQEDILIYGYVLVIENLYKAIILFIIALLTKTVFETLITIGTFMLLRNFSGGIHCKSSLACTFCMLGVWGIGVIVSKIEIPVLVLFLMCGIILGTIICYAPATTITNPIVKKSIRKRKHCSAIITVISLLIIGLIIRIQFGVSSVLNMIIVSMFIEAFSILLLLEKEEKRNEER